MQAAFHPIGSRADAEAQVCAAIATLGRLAGIDVDLGEGPDDIDASLIQAAYESHFGDPHGLGGPGCFARAATLGDVATLSILANGMTRRLVRYIGRRGAPATVQEAQAQVALVDTAFDWLARQVAQD